MPRASGGGIFDAGEHLASGAWAKEVIATADERGLTVTESDERFVCYPSLVKVVAGDAAIEVDRKRERRLRPSVVVEALVARQAPPIRFRPEPFLEATENAYGWVVERGGERSWGAVVRLVDMWEVLTLLPGSGRDYTKPELARDLYMLDQSGVVTTKANRRLRFSASTGTKTAGVLTTVAKDGRPVNYWGRRSHERDVGGRRVRRVPGQGVPRRLCRPGRVVGQVLRR